MNNRRIAVSEITVGQPLPWDVYGDGGSLLVRAGHIVASETQFEMLLARGFVFEEERVAAPRDMPSVLRMLNLALAQLQHALEDIVAGRGPAAIELDQIARQVIAAVDLDQEVALACIQLNQAAGAYPVRHGIDTAIVCLIAGRALKIPSPQLLSLLQAALTMNVGMLHQHERLRDLEAPLTPADHACIQGHPQAGVRLLREAGIADPDWLSYILQHHENDDGSGYPRGLTAAQVSEPAKLLALADRYCARVAPRAYRKAMLPNAALRDILMEGKRTVDTRLVTLLVRELGIYPIGSFVRLLNGEIGMVTRKGLNAATPYVHALVGPRGAPLDTPSRRDTKSDLHAIREVLSQEQAGVTPRLEQLWGAVARA